MMSGCSAACTAPSPFVALGGLLVLSSYVYSQYRERIEGWWRERS